MLELRARSADLSPAPTSAAYDAFTERMGHVHSWRTRSPLATERPAFQPVKLLDCCTWMARKPDDWRPGARPGMRRCARLALFRRTLGVKHSLGWAEEGATRGAVSTTAHDPPRSARTEPAEPAAKPVRASWHVLGIPALAAAAALAIWLCLPTPGRLPGYQLEIASAAGPLSPAGAARDTPARVELEPGRDLTLTFRPSSVPAMPIEARAYVAPGAAPDGAAQPLPARSAAAGPGVLRLSVSGAALPAAGRVIVLLGHEGSLPTSPSTGSAWRGHGWQRFEIALTRPGAAR